MTTKFIRSLRIINKFPCGYDPQATVFSCAQDQQPDPHGASAGEALFIYESTGRVVPCADPDAFRVMRQRKAAMDLTIAMWKEDMEIYYRAGAMSGTRWPCFVLARDIVLSGIPASFLKQIGLLDLAHITIRELGFYMSKRTLGIERMRP